MGISVEEYLAKKAACSDCIAHGDEDHCISTLLSREDNCLFYNIILAYHLPNKNKTEAFKPDEMTSVAVQTEFALLTALRNKIKEEKVVEYYVRAQNIVTMIKGIHQNDRLIWAGYYDRYVTDILKDIKDGKDEDAVTKMYIMIEELENTNGRVICTWLVKNNKMSKADLDLDHMFTVKNINFNTRLGYLFWAVPMVDSLDSMIKRNSVLDRAAIAIVQKLAQARANEVKYCMGYIAHSDLLGKCVRFFGEGFCYLLGFLLKTTIAQKSKTKLR